MNKTYLLTIASILATASLMAGTFTVAAFAQNTTTPPSSEMDSTVMDVSNMTGSGGNATYGGGNATAEANTGNSTTPM
jgi:hypothetical protein